VLMDVFQSKSLKNRVFTQSLQHVLLLYVGFYPSIVQGVGSGLHVPLLYVGFYCILGRSLSS
jgi:phosphate starvation-inducible membrane PsiE